jgi:hypothetical protein
MIRALLILLGLGTAVFAAPMMQPSPPLNMPAGPADDGFDSMDDNSNPYPMKPLSGSSMPGATGKDSDRDGIDDTFDATPNGMSPMGRPKPPVDDFNPDDPAGLDDDGFSSPASSAAPPAPPPSFNPAPMANAPRPQGPMQIGRNAYDPDETRGAAVDTTPGGSIPGFKQLPADKQQQKLKGMENIRYLQTALIEGDKEGLCGENGVCRRNFGEGCTTSKNFLSVCATMCVDNNEFRGSHCIVNGAKRYKMNAQTFVYEPRPEKQKRAESVADHIIIQLREGRKALRSDKRLFFNTLCTPPSVNMIPGDANRRRVAEACAYFLYNGFPPPNVLNTILIGGPANSQGYTPPPPPVTGQPMMPQPVAAPMMGGSPDDVNAPVGGLPADPNAGEDQGAVYDGPGTPIIEDKESAPKKKKGKKGKKGKRPAAMTAAPVAAPPAPADNTPPPADDAAAPADDGSQAAPADDGSTPPDDASAAAPDQNADPNMAPDAAAAPPPPSPAAPQQAAPPKQNALMGGIQGMMKKFGKKKGGQPAGDPNAGGDDQNAAPAGGNMPSAMGKFMKF